MPRIIGRKRKWHYMQSNKGNELPIIHIYLQMYFIEIINEKIGNWFGFSKEMEFRWEFRPFWNVILTNNMTVCQDQVRLPSWNISIKLATENMRETNNVLSTLLELNTWINGDETVSTCYTAIHVKMLKKSLHVKSCVSVANIASSDKQ